MIIKTLIADDSQIFRKKVIDVLKKYTDIQILGEAETGEEAVNKALTLKPDLIIMDVRMPDMDGIIATNTIKNKYPEIKIIMASIHDLAEYRAAAKKVVQMHMYLNDPFFTICTLKSKTFLILHERRLEFHHTRIIGVNLTS